MVLLSGEGLGKRFNERTLFSNIDLALHEGDRIGLIGKNGCGKSTLMRILSLKLNPDSGKVVYSDGVQLILLEQDPQPAVGESLMDFVLSSPDPRFKALRDYEAALKYAESKPDLLHKAMEKMDSEDAWVLEHEARSMLGKLGLNDTTLQADLLSGGQKKKAALVSALLQNPDVLLLDEPTNHLDLESIEWMENELYKRGGTLLFTTHDRYFLDKVSTGIVEMSTNGMKKYQTGYAGYLEKKAEEDAALHAQTAKYKNLYTKELDWIRRQPKARGTKAKYRVDAFEGIKEKAFQKTNDSKLKLDVVMSRQGTKVLELQKVSKNYESKTLLHQFEYIFKKGDRIGVVGPNGVGKTTLLRLLSGEILPDDGEIVKGETTVIGYYRQDQQLKASPDTRVIDLIQEKADQYKMADGSQISASQLLTRFQYEPSRQYDRIGFLSGGEIRRLQLLLVLAERPNFLILDEPTNDLDIPTLQVLEDFLGEFSGCLMIVSHDRYFMDNLVDQLLVLEGDGKYKWFPGNYTQYRLDTNQKEEVYGKMASKKTDIRPNDLTAANNSKNTKRSNKVQQEINALEAKINQFNEEISALEASLNTTDHSELMNITIRIGELRQMLEKAELQWLELSED